MIYDSLRTLPYLTAHDIISTGNIALLSDQPQDPEFLFELWERLHDEFQKLFNGTGQKKVFDVTKEVEYLENKYECILNACRALEFDSDEALIGMLRGYGYRFRLEHYQADLIQITREAKGIEVKISQLRNMLPKQVEGEATGDMAIIEQMAAYSAVLGIDFDYNTISCMKFKALEYQVKTKIKQIEKQNRKK